MHRSVYRMAGVPTSAESNTLGAVLAAGEGAAASHASAAWLWGLVPEAPRRPQVTVPLPRHARLQGVEVHRTLDLAPRWVRLRRGIPTTDPLRTMLELGDRLPRQEVVDALERGVMSSRFSVAALEWVRLELGVQGRNGCGVLRSVLEVDGYEVHGTPAAMEADFDRQNRLVAVGWTPIRFGWHRLIKQPSRVAEQIRAVLASLRDR